MSPTDSSRPRSFSVRFTLWIAKLLLRRPRARLDAATRSEILAVLAHRLRDAREDGSLPGFVLRAARECAALAGLAPVVQEPTLGGLRGWMDDAVLAAKGLARRPTFALTAVLILALGIGAGTAAFSVLDSVLYRMPSYDRDGTLAVVWKELHGGAFRIGGHSREEVDLYREAESFAGVATYITDTVPMFDGERSTRVLSRAIDEHLLPMLGVGPVLGRAFAEEDRGLDRILISESLWTERYGRDPEVLGQTLEVDGALSEIIGVLPPTASAHSMQPDVDVWLPLDLERDLDRFTLSALVRLQPDLEASAAEAELQSLMAAKLERAENDPPMKTLVRRLQEDRVPGDTASRLWMIFAGVGLLLLTACANASSLALTRDAGRAHELRTRLALGASPGRVIRLLGLEGLLMALVAALLGGLASWQVVPALVRFAPDQIRSLVDAGGSGSARTLVFLVLVSLVASVLVTLVPVIRFRLRRRARRRAEAADGRSTRRWGTALVTGQVAIAFVLLIASGLLLRSFERMMSIEPGYALDRMQAKVQLPAGVEEPEAIESFFDRVKEEVGTLPGLRRVAWADAPTEPAIWGGINFQVDGEPRPIGEPGGLLALLSGDLDMFRTLGIDLVAGRAYQVDDGDDTVVIGESLAAALFGDEDPIGRSVQFSEERDPLTVIGVAQNVRVSGPEEPLGPWEVYRRTAPHRAGSRAMVLDFERDPVSRIPEVRAAVARVDARAPVDGFETLGDRWHASMERPRFLVEMAVLLAALTLALTLFGLYSVLSYAVAQRRREIGLRMALGANAGRVRWLVMRQSAFAVGLGLVLGGTVSWMLRRSLESQLFETAIVDAWSVSGAILFLLAASLVASWVPAARATRIEPSRSLRED